MSAREKAEAMRWRREMARRSKERRYSRPVRPHNYQQFRHEHEIVRGWIWGCLYTSALWLAALWLAGAWQ